MTIAFSRSQLCAEAKSVFFALLYSVRSGGAPVDAPVNATAAQMSAAVCSRGRDAIEEAVKELGAASVGRGASSRSASSGIPTNAVLGEMAAEVTKMINEAVERGAARWAAAGRRRRQRARARAGAASRGGRAG